MAQGIAPSEQICVTMCSAVQALRFCILHKQPGNQSVTPLPPLPVSPCIISWDERMDSSLQPCAPSNQHPPLPLPASHPRTQRLSVSADPNPTPPGFPPENPTVARAAAMTLASSTPCTAMGSDDNLRPRSMAPMRPDSEPASEPAPAPPSEVPALEMYLRAWVGRKDKDEVCGSGLQARGSPSACTALLRPQNITP